MAIKSPFPGILENAKLTFNVDELGPDLDDLGNPTADGDTGKYVAFIKSDVAAQRILDSQSVGQSRLAITGYLIRPMQFSRQTIGLDECKVEVEDSRLGKVRGLLRFNTRITPTILVESITGARFTGTITIQGR